MKIPTILRLVLHKKIKHNFTRSTKKCFPSKKKIYLSTLTAFLSFYLELISEKKTFFPIKYFKNHHNCTNCALHKYYL